MPLIIAATDFSAVAENAIRYACSLAQAQNCRVIIVHSFNIPVMFSDIPMPGTIVNDAQNDAEEQMKKLVDSISAAYAGVPISGQVIYGTAINAVDDLADEISTPWMVVIGNNNQGENNTWPESVLMDSFRKLAYPVLAVPGAQHYRQVKKICFAFDNKHKGDDVAFGQIASLAGLFNAELHVLHVQPDAAARQEIDSDAKAKLAAASPQYHFVYGVADVDAAINDFINVNGMDWLVMIPRRHSFFEGLFHKSHIKSIAHSSSIPVLALHERE